MPWSWKLLAAAGMALLTLNCTKPPDEAGAVETPAPIPAPAGPEGVTGRLAPAAAPPSSLVVLEPAADIELPVKSEPAIMDQAGYEFLPGFLIAQVGQVVEFRNSEDVLHNVRVTKSKGLTPIFNVATTPFGKYEHTFDHTGSYTVTCDIHPTMRASILITATPYSATTGPDGSFSIADVPPGQYTLTAYGPPDPLVRSVEVKPGKTELGEIR